jgi:hypothetical protein
VVLSARVTAFIIVTLKTIFSDAAMYEVVSCYSNLTSKNLSQLSGCVQASYQIVFSAPGSATIADWIAVGVLSWIAFVVFFFCYMAVVNR